MVKKWIKNINFGKSFCAVEHLNVEQKLQLNFLLLKKQKREFVVEENKICFEFDDLFKLIKKNQHLFLIINNENVLTKSIEGKIDKLKALQTAFPNLNFDEFYYESYSSESKTYVSICRKKYMDKLINEYQNKKFNVVGFSLGNLITSQVIPFIDESEFYTNNALISIKNQEIENIAKVDDVQDRSYNINDLKIKNTSILCLAGILSYYTNQSKTQNNFKEKIIGLQNNFKQKRIFDLGLKTGLSFVFILLMFNFLIFSNYRDKINELQNEIEISESYKGNLLTLKEEVDKKKKIVDEITSSETSRVTLYLDKIGASVPSSVLLKDINYQPLLKNIKKDKEIQYEHQQILVKGLSTNGDAFSKWIASLEIEKWIKSITLVKYGTGKKVTTEFQIKITLSE